MSERRSPEWTRRLLLHGTTDLVGRCRDFTRRALTEWQWLPETGSGNRSGNGGEDEGGDETAEAADDVLLLVSEVVANACMHAGGPSSMLLHCTAERLRIEVTDSSPVLPAYRFPTDPARPGGHGLLIVKRLARAWGADPVDGGKCVWVEVATPPALREHGAPPREPHGRTPPWPSRPPGPS
ncbi:ATP-binding protein [Streptomyces sp. NBC_00335]|uniref:ATP-binding protein n=1 Tax=unclassified Streptomyces TaxID=2593676 RepID=UPI0022524826|nr:MULTISPECIES: ATP-binding protein [unclassified Streptomyces]MCX5409333.1 ATP-binding protein [Streptomyces sp. NBC_00086]